jgi:putative addiction module killer protein
MQAHIDLAENVIFSGCTLIGEGASEMRIHIRTGYQVYFKNSGIAIYVLLAGGNISTQKRDIKLAPEIANEIKVKK